MKMSLTLYSDPVGIADIERFSFDDFQGPFDECFTQRVAFPSVDIDPLIPEQTVRVDLGSNTGMINYAVASYLIETDVLPKQDMDKYPAYWFYYVTAIERKRSSTVCEIHLKLDGVTTLLYAKVSSLNALFTDQCYIRREHRDRFLYPSSGTYTNLQYDIDRIPENIPVVKKKTRMTALTNKSGVKPNMKWYIVYKAKKSWSGADASSANAIQTYLLPDESLKVSDSTSSGSGAVLSWTGIDDIPMAENQVYYLSNSWSPSYLISLGGIHLNAAGVFMTAWRWHYSGTAVIFETWDFKGSPGAITEIDYNTTTYNDPSSISAIVSRMTHFRVLPDYTTDQDAIDAGTHIDVGAGTTTVSAIYSADFATLDRTDPLLVKIIETPYCPGVISKDANDNYSIARATFDQQTKMWKPNSNFLWQQTLYDGTALTSYIIPAVQTWKAVDTAAAADDWDGFDPKLLHSDFYELKVVYDSFSVSSHLEDIVLSTNALITASTSRYLSASWHVSRDINSVFAVRLSGTYTAESKMESKTQDFGDWVVIDRNNERPLFTNAYLNYMRAGYNYDQKAKAMQNWSAIAGVALSAVGTGVGVAAGNPLIAVSGAAGLIASISSAAMGAAQRDNSMEGKLAQLKAQGTSVSGSSDVAILDLYSQQAYFVEYRPEKAIQGSLARLFHLYGYATGEYKKPDITSRSLWNYVEGDMILNQSAVTGIPQQVAARAIEQFAKGITIIHGTYDIYDMTQHYENWENRLL